MRADRFNISPRDVAARSPFRHLVRPRATSFQMPPQMIDFTIDDAYSALAVSEERNRQIITDMVNAVVKELHRSCLPNRTEHLARLARDLCGMQHVLILKGGMSKKERSCYRAIDSDPRTSAARTSSIVGIAVSVAVSCCALSTQFMWR